MNRHADLTRVLLGLAQTARPFKPSRHKQVVQLTAREAKRRRKRRRMAKRSRQRNRR